MSKVDEIMVLVRDDAFAMSFQSIGQYRSALLKALAQPAQEAEPELCDPSCGTYDLASMILSDCGHSSNNQRLLDRVAARIDKRLAAVIAASTQPQPAGEAEPVAWIGPGFDVEFCKKPWMGSDWKPLYTTPQQSQPLTDEQIMDIQGKYVGGPTPSFPLDTSDWLSFARAIEAAHNIKGVTE